MFRPLTFLTLAMACGSGLYLYQVKHQAQVLDRKIERTVKATESARAQARELNAAWTLLGNPSRLQQLADQFLDIKPVQPSQFVSLADLDTRLPAPRALDAAPVTPPVDGVPDSTLPVALREPPPAIATTAPSPAVAASEPAKPSAVAMTRPAERKPPDAPRPEHDVAQAPLAPSLASLGAPYRPVAPHPAARPVIAELDRPVAPMRQITPRPMPTGGSLLGMAHAGSSPPPPRPIPISTAPSSSVGN